MIVYHYCTVEKMVKILSLNEIWLANSRKMNDYAEGRWIDTILRTVLEKEYSMNDPRFEPLLKQYSMNSIPFYMACFSEEQNSLSQWRAYSADATGVAIGFEIDETGIPIAVPRPNASPKLSIGWAKVEYDEAAQYNRVSAVLKNWLTIDQEKDDGNFRIELAAQLRNMAMIFKNGGFIEEKEWRLINTPVVLGDSSRIQILGNISEMNFLPSEDTIRSYLKYSFKTRTVKRIILGPKNRLDSYDFGNFLMLNQYVGIDVVQSGTTYS